MKNEVLSSFDAARVRKDFPTLHQEVYGKPLIYFDNGATTFKPNAVIEAITDFYQNGYATVHRAVYEIAQHSDDLYHNARKTVQKFIGAQSQKEVVFTASTTDSNDSRNPSERSISLPLNL